MKTLHLEQGTPEWHAHRATHFNASDAPAMLGCSPYQTRTELLHRLHTGVSPEVDAGQQRRFDDGHRFEALCRPFAETIVGEDLYPVTGSKGELSASFDGLTMDESTGFEHKTLNDQLRAALISDAGADALPKAYRVQMEQQCMVSGASRILFVASKWADNEMVEEMHAWYEPDAELRAEILAGWAQFAADLAAYVPAAVVAEVVGRTPETLPALHITLKGEVSASNLAEFKEIALSAIRAVNRDLKTDQDFADSAKSRKWCEDIETRVAAAKEHALGQTQSVDQLFRTMDEISTEARDVRLALEKLEEARKESRKVEIVASGSTGLSEHCVALHERTRGLLPYPSTDFAGAIRGLKTFSSMQNAVDTLLAAAKIAATAAADKIEGNLKTLRAAADYASLFPDTAALVLKAPDDLAAVIASRIAAHKAAEEAKAAAAPPPAPAPAPAPVTYSRAAPAVRQAAVVEHQDDISRFLGSRRWEKDQEQFARAVLVEYQKFCADPPGPRLALIF